MVLSLYGGGSMKTAAVSELKARLSEYLDQVKAGSEIVVTDRGRPVARLVPVSRTKAMGESLSSLEREGLIKLGSGRLPDGFWKMPRAKDSGRIVLSALLEERGQGR
jgi:prevent-host-death family protein